MRECRDIRIAVSACLLGEEVRYDGGHRRSRYVAEGLGGAFTLVPECPEVGIGLGVPRPKIRLEAGSGGVRLVGAGGRDLTARMTAYAEAASDRFGEAGVAGLVLKSRSPSCGLGDAKLHHGGTVLSRRGTGIFAGAVLGLPRTSETGLEDPARRDHWLTRVFAFAELRRLEGREGLDAFHRRWETALMAHSEAAALRLAHARDDLPAYRSGFLAGLAAPPTVAGYQKVLLRLAGRLDPADREAARGEILAFADRRVPLAAPVRKLAALSDAGGAFLEERPASLGYREGIYGLSARTRR